MTSPTPTPGLIIHGVESAGEIVCLTQRDLTRVNRWVVENGVGTVAGITFDESDLVENAAVLEDCADCEGPGLVVVEGRTVCPGHAAGFGAAEDASMEAAR